MMAGALDGVRILDMSAVGMGPILRANGLNFWKKRTFLMPA